MRKTQLLKTLNKSHKTSKNAIRLLVFVALFVALMCFFVPCLTAANAEENIEKKLEDSVSKYADSLDSKDLEEFLERTTGDEILQGKSLSEVISEMTKGNIKIDAATLLSAVFSRFTSAFTSVLPAILTVAVIALLGSFLSGLTCGFEKKQTVDVVHFVCYSLVLIIVMKQVSDVVMTCSKTVSDLTGLMEVAFPPLITLMSALGGSVSSSIYKPQLAFFCVLIGKIINTLVLPLFICSVVFCVVGNLSTSIKTDKIQSTIRYISNTLICAVFGLFITYLAIAGIAGGMVDGVSIKAAKFMVSSYVPILGGYLSQGFDLVSASVVLIKNSIGVIGMLGIVLIIVAPIVKIVAFSLALKLTASVLQPVGDKRISDFLYSVSNCVKTLIAAIVGIGFVFLITLLLVIITCNVGVV